MKSSLVFEMEGDMFAMIPMPKYLWLYARPYLSRHHGATGGCLTVEIEKKDSEVGFCNLFFPVSERLDSFPFSNNEGSIWDPPLLVDYPDDVRLQPCLVPLTPDRNVMDLSTLMQENPNGLLATGGHIIPSYASSSDGETILLDLRIVDEQAGSAQETWIWVGGVLVCTRVVACGSLTMFRDIGMFDPELFHITRQVDQAVKDLIGPYSMV